MYTDIYGQQVYSENDLLDVYLTNPDFVCSGSIFVDKPIRLDKNLDLNNFPKLITYITSNQSIEDFDNVCKNNWFIPDEYRNFDIAKFVLDQCTTDEELQRVGKELLLYHERGMFILLQYLKYLVDTMRANNIVWGVGRGSSVASFVLFLIGVHKINSLYYDLPIEEFLK